MKFLLAMKKPARILEVGTAGIFVILMAEYDSVPCQITTIDREFMEKRFRLPGRTLREPIKEAQIALLRAMPCGGAKDAGRSVYDLLLWTRQKRQYIHFRRRFWRLLAKDGVLVSDNVLQDGDVIESRFAVTRRNRTIHKRMRNICNNADAQ